MVGSFRAVEVHGGAVERQRRSRALYVARRVQRLARPCKKCGVRTYVLVGGMKGAVVVVGPEAVGVRGVAPPLVVHDQRARVVD